MSGVVILRDEISGETFTRDDVEAMRRALEEQTGLDLSTMTAKSVVANYWMQQARAAADDPDGLAAERGQRPHVDDEGYEVTS